MSKGMQQRLGLAQALIGSPRMLLLDEPTSALDPAGRRTVRALLEELRGRGVSVLLNSHLLSEVELVCDRVAIIARGALVAAGTPAELAHAGGVEVETANGHAPVRRRRARGRAADRARPGRGGRGGLRRARAHVDARGRLPRGGRRLVNQVRVIAVFTLRESLRRRVFLVVALLTVAFLGLYALGHLAAQPGHRRRGEERARRRSGGARRRHAARARDVRDDVPRHRARGLPHARRRPRGRRARAAAAAARPPGHAPHAAARPLRRRRGGLRRLRRRRLPRRHGDHLDHRRLVAGPT